VVDNNLPKLSARIEIIRDPVCKRRWVRREGWRRSVESVGAGKVVVEQVRIRIEIEEVCVSIVERIVTLMVDLCRQTRACVNLGGIAKRCDRSRRTVALSLISEREAGGGRCCYIPVVLDIEAGRTILWKIEIVEIGECVSAAQVTAESGSSIVSQEVGRDAGTA